MHTVMEFLDFSNEQLDMLILNHPSTFYVSLMPDRHVDVNNCKELIFFSSFVNVFAATDLFLLALGINSC